MRFSMDHMQWMSADRVAQENKVCDTVRATAAAVRPGATRRGASSARTVRATGAAAVAPGGRGGEDGEGGEIKCYQQ